jgi:hypothetical protein
VSTEDRSSGQEPDDARRAQQAPQSPQSEEAPGPEPDERQPGEPEAPPDERLRILRLVAQGRVTADEAAELLGALEPQPAPAGARPGAVPPGASTWPPGPGPLPPSPPFGSGPFGPGGFNPFGGRQGPFGGRPGPDARWTAAWNDPGAGRAGQARAVAGAPGRGGPAYVAGGAQRRTLVIIHRSGDGAQVESRVPLDLGEAGLGLIPKQVREGLEHHEIKLDEVLERPQILAATPAGETIVSLQDVDGGQLTISVE